MPHDLLVGEVVMGSESVATGRLTRGQLRWNYRPLFPDVYIARDAEVTLYHRTVAAWLWSKRRGVITGRAAAALHGAKWVDDAAPVELLWANNHCPDGIRTRRETIAADEWSMADGLAVATPARTALDLGRHLSAAAAAVHLDALAAATGVTSRDVLLLTGRYAGTKGVKKSRDAVAMMDGGAQSPKETWLRLMLIRAGFPTPRTQIPLLDDYGRPFAFLDMGWPDVKIAVEYDGDHHRTDRAQYAWDVRRLRLVTHLGWLHVRVIAEDPPADIVRRVRDAWALREREALVVKRPA